MKIMMRKTHDLHSDLPFLLKRMKTEKVQKLAANLHDTHEKFKSSIKSWISI